MAECEKMAQERNWHTFPNSQLRDTSVWNGTFVGDCAAWELQKREAREKTRQDILMDEALRHPAVVEYVVEKAKSLFNGATPDAPMTVTPGGGKHSLIEAAWTQLDGPALNTIAEVLYQGSQKYGKDNWRAISEDDHINHVLMHLFAHVSGDRSDEHLAHAFTRMMMAVAVHLRPDYLGAFANTLRSVKPTTRTPVPPFEPEWVPTGMSRDEFIAKIESEPRCGRLSCEHRMSLHGNSKNLDQGSGRCNGLGCRCEMFAHKSVNDLI